MVVVEVFVIEENEIVFGKSFSFVLFVNTDDKKIYFAGGDVRNLIDLILRDAYEELV
ncbi:unnamed protein product [marine sediment metagenome]|uniref:Uncharacterized protein n=1 Tax=marine sediment metagenome TaxID=412755 RepID=X1S4K3_9ZZZZ